MELRHLRYFIAVAEEMSFRAAAERLHISQPPLSQQIKQLEEEIGTDLFIRHKRSIFLTEAGEQFLIRAREIVQSSQDAKEEALRASEGKIGTLNVGFISSSGTGFLQRTVRAYKTLYPDVELIIKQSTHERILNGLPEGKFDVGLVRLPLNYPDTMVATPCEKIPYVVAIPSDHKLSKRKSIGVDDLCHEKLIIYPRRITPIEYDQVLSLFLDEGITPDIDQEAIEQHTILSLISSGMGFGITPKIMENFSIPGVSFIPLKGKQIYTTQAAITLKKPNILVHNFLNCLSPTKNASKDAF